MGAVFMGTTNTLNVLRKSWQRPTWINTNTHHTHTHTHTHTHHTHTHTQHTPTHTHLHTPCHCVLDIKSFSPSFQAVSSLLKLWSYDLYSKGTHRCTIFSQTTAHPIKKREEEDVPFLSPFSLILYLLPTRSRFFPPPSLRHDRFAGVI